MTTYFDIMQRASHDRVIRRLSREIADTGFPLEKYLEFFFPRGNYLVSEESYADSNARWGERIGQTIGAFGGPLGSAALGWVGNKIGNLWGGRRDQQGAADPKYWQQRFEAAFKGLSDVMNGMNQNLNNPEFVKAMKPMEVLQRVEQAVGQWKQTIGAVSEKPAAVQTADNRITNAPAGVGGSQIAGQGPVSDPTNGAGVGVPGVGGQQVVGATGGSTNSVMAGGGGDQSFAQDPHMAGAGPGPAAGGNQPLRDAIAKTVSPQERQQARMAAQSGNFQALQGYLQKPEIAAALQSVPDEKQKIEQLAAMMAESRQRRGGLISESRRVVNGYRRIDPRIWG